MSFCRVFRSMDPGPDAILQGVQINGSLYHPTGCPDQWILVLVPFYRVFRSWYPSTGCSDPGTLLQDVQINRSWSWYHSTGCQDQQILVPFYRVSRSIDPGTLLQGVQINRSWSWCHSTGCSDQGSWYWYPSTGCSHQGILVLVPFYRVFRSMDPGIGTLLQGVQIQGSWPGVYRCYIICVYSKAG